MGKDRVVSCSLGCKCIYGCSNEGGNNKDGRELVLPGLLYVDLVLCGESEEDQRAMVGSFVGV